MTALVAMLMVEGVENQEVILPSLTFCATPHAVRLAGGIPVFADVTPDTLTLDPADVLRKISSRTKAILGVDVYGIACDQDEIWEVALKREIDVLYDSAPAFGTLVNGKPLGGGAWVDARIFSFHATKPFAVGESGALCSDDPFFISHAKKIRNFGLCSPPDTIYSTVGFNGKMQEINALIGLEQLKGFGLKIANRNAAAAYMNEALEGIDGLTTIKCPADQMPAWCYFPVLVDEAKFGMSRDAVMAALERRGIMTRRYYEACHLHTSYADEKTRLPTTERVADQVIALPVYSDMTGSECDRIASAVREIRSTGA